MKKKEKEEVEEEEEEELSKTWHMPVLSYHDRSLHINQLNLYAVSYLSFDLLAPPEQLGQSRRILSFLRE